MGVGLGFCFTRSIRDDGDIDIGVCVGNVGVVDVSNIWSDSSAKSVSSLLRVGGAGYVTR